MQTMKSTFLYQDTQLPAYLQFPEFLLRLPISQTAKVVYLVLYDRSRLSMKNEWFDDENRAYIIYTIDSIMEDLGCAKEKAVKVLAELDSVKGIGLVEKVRRGLGKPDIIYVKN